MNAVLSYLAARAKEPSTWAGLATVLVGTKLIPNNPDLISAITAGGIFLGGALAAAFPEGGK